MKKNLFEAIVEFAKLNDVEIHPTTLPVSTRTALEAAQTVGCDVSQIAKSIIFKTVKTNKPVLVIASGKNRINEEIISKLINEPIEKANADFVKNQTGFIIGGIPPFGHKQAITTFINQDLLKFETVWAAAGSPFAVFEIKSTDLIKVIPFAKILKIN